MHSSRFDVSTFGEIMLRLSVPTGQRLETTSQLAVHPAGAETNVASLLARLGRKTRWFGALPANPLGRLAANQLRLAGVDLSCVLWHEDGRLGTYYVEFGELPRGIQVTYDRAGSAITTVRPDEIDWEALADCRLLHLTGITPALSDSCLDITKRALHFGKQRGLPISFDINYRQRLWAPELARETLLPMIQGAELLFCSREDARRVFNCKGSAQEMAEKLREISHARSVVITIGEEGALLWDGAAFCHEGARQTTIIDRLGAGDALAAGVIHGWLGGDIRMGMKYGVTLAALALSQHGDMVVTSSAELESLTQSASSITR